MTAEQFLQRLDGVKATGDGHWQARCPAHDDRTASLSIALGEQSRILLTCHASCPTEEIVASIDLTMADLFDANERRNGDGKKEIVAAYDYVGEDGELLYQVCRFNPKDFRQRKPDGRGGWEWRLGKTRRVLYRLPAVVKAAATGGEVCVVEGEKDVEALEKRDIIATCNPGGAGKWKPQYAESLRGARVAVIADRDEPGRKHARDVATSLAGIAAAVRIFEPAEGKDVSDHLAAGRELSELVEAGEEEKKKSEKKPGSNPVDHGPPPAAGALLDNIASTIRRYVVVSDAQRDAVALWVLHAHAIEIADTTPYLSISSAEKQSGKSRLLETLAQLVPRAMEAANVSDAALFRALSGDNGPATLLYDEVDALFGKQASNTKEEQRGLLNAGYRRGAVAWRCEGDGSKQTVTPYPVFGAKALAGIGQLPETLADRSIQIRLRRRRPDEKVERGRYKVIAATCEPLKRAAERWAAHCLEALREAEPELPDELSDRAQDGAEPLLAIADLAGGEWPQRAREALVELHGDQFDDAESWGVRLLTDIRRAFEDDDRLPTSALLLRLKRDDEAPWGSWGKIDGGMTPRHLASLLRPYGIHSRSVRLDDGSTPKGYHRDQFADAWERYLLPGTDSQPPQRHNGSTEPKTGDFYPPQTELVADRKGAANPHSRAVVADVAAGSANRESGDAPREAEAEVEVEDGPLVQLVREKYGAEEAS